LSGQRPPNLVNEQLWPEFQQTDPIKFTSN
jgi:hypothetical protein